MAGLIHESIDAQLQKVQSWLKPGDHVVFGFIPSCGRCYLCTHGNPTLCAEYSSALFTSTRPDGTSPLSRGDEVVFRVEGDHAIVARTPDFLTLAGTIRVPAAKHNVAWDEVIRSTRSDRAAARR